MADIAKVGTFVQNSPYPAWLATGNGDCVYGNPALERLTGLSSEEIIQAQWRSFLLDEDRVAATASWQRSLAIGIPYRVRVRMRGIDGVTTTVELTAFGHRVDDGTELWLFLGLQVHAATYQDATLEAQLQATLNVIPTNGWYTLPSGALTFVNQQTGDYLGLPKDHPLRFGIDTGAAWDSHIPFIHPDDHEETRRVWSTCLRTGSAGQVPFRIRNAEGEYRWFLNRVGPLRADDGTLLYWVGANLDINDAKLAEQALQLSEAYLAESKAKLEEAQRITHVGYWEWDLVTDCITWSDEIYRIFGMHPQECPIDLATSQKRIHQDDWQNVAGAVEEALAGGTRFDVEARILRPTGEVRIVRSMADVKRDASGRPYLLFGTNQDITEQKRAERERERLHQLEAELAHINRVSMLGEMASSLAHEIKQPIAAAITSANSCIEWLAQIPPNLDRARAAAARIDSYGHRAAEIIDRMRSFYKKSPPQREWVEVNGIIQEMLTMLKGQARRFSIAVRTDLSAALPKIMADRVQLQQVLMNLMLNGIEAMEDSGGELTVKSALQDGQLQFSVSDTGVGLPIDKMDQIFSTFFTTKPQGSGMGLAISLSIVESHGGRLWGAANNGRGATFHFTLPIAGESLREPSTIT